MIIAHWEREKTTLKCGKLRAWSGSNRAISASSCFSAIISSRAQQMGVAITFYNYWYISFYVLCCYWFICLLLLESVLIFVPKSPLIYTSAAYFCSAGYHETDNVRTPIITFRVWNMFYVSYSYFVNLTYLSILNVIK